jgi:hypothetical protein
MAFFAQLVAGFDQARRSTVDERLGWEEMAAAKRTTRRCVSWREDFGMAQTNGITARCADGGTRSRAGNQLWQ